MSDVVDSDELLRRIQRARDWAAQEERHWKTQSGPSEATEADGAREADILAHVYEAVRKVLDEVVTPGSNSAD
ncbi:hypothetical protein [Streptomyces sp. NPDC054842]